jgi:glycerol-3-phosphate dehydrogenase
MQEVLHQKLRTVLRECSLYSQAEAARHLKIERERVRQCYNEAVQDLREALRNRTRPGFLLMRAVWEAAEAAMQKREDPSRQSKSRNTWK